MIVSASSVSSATTSAASTSSATTLAASTSSTTTMASTTNASAARNASLTLELSIPEGGNLILQLCSSIDFNSSL